MQLGAPSYRSTNEKTAPIPLVVKYKLTRINIQIFGLVLQIHVNSVEVDCNIQR